MAVRGVYSPAEQKMIADYNELADTMVGWAKTPTKKVATEESMISYGLASDFWNPLWHDESYAQNTRWGGLIAFPFYQERFGGGMPFLQTTPECGYPDHIYVGDDWEFFKPVRVGDTFRVWCNWPMLEDITSLDGKGPRRYKHVPSDLVQINQRDEVVSTFKRYTQMTFHAEPLKKVEAMPESKYKYTKEELAYIEHIADEEEVRGAKIRYFEDVSVGDITQPVELGPTNNEDNQLPGGGQRMPQRELRKREPWNFVQDPETGVYYSVGAVHLSDRGAQLCGRPLAFHYGPLARNLMARLITNWMGDDGFLRKYSFRHIAQTPIGDTVIGRGVIVNRQEEKGEHLVDLAVWLENIRGYLTEVATATVSLYSRKDSFG